MHNIIFTLCSNNYLAHAKTLGDSINHNNPEVRFLIGLVDHKDPVIDYEKEVGHEIVECDSIGFPCFKEMLTYYNIIEFNTAVKPYYFEYFFKRFGADSRILYLDPDIVVYRSLQSLFSLLNQSDILLTPNLILATEEVNSGELVSLRHGMYNLGFIGIRQTTESMRFLTWWQKRLYKHCVIRKSKGLFVDQKWIDLAPLFFTGICIIRDPGYNMAWWNLAERKLTKHKGTYFVNDPLNPLYFFHFSGYTPGSNQFSGRNNNQNEYFFDSHPELIELFNSYASRLMRNGFEKMLRLKPLLRFKETEINHQSGIILRFKKITKSLFSRRR